MRTNQLSTIDTTDLARVHGGQEPAQGPNYQHDMIGVSHEGTTVGMEKQGGRSDYALCLDGALKNNWSPEQVAATCNPLHSPGN
jgi:hypothetical protein